MQILQVFCPTNDEKNEFIEIWPNNTPHVFNEVTTLRNIWYSEVCHSTVLHRPISAKKRLKLGYAFIKLVS